MKTPQTAREFRKYIEIECGERTSKLFELVCEHLFQNWKNDSQKYVIYNYGESMYDSLRTNEFLVKKLKKAGFEIYFLVGRDTEDVSEIQISY